jgi:hypothetical protein
MATNRKLRAELLRQLGGVSPQALSQRVKKIKRQLPMSTEDAAYVIAHQRGLDLTKYLSQEKVSHVRSLVQALNSGGTPTRSPAGGKRQRYERRVVNINITGVASKLDVLLSSSVAEDAKAMAKLYPIYYVLENSLRVVIKRVLDAKHGAEWWNKRVPKEVADKVSDRKNKEAKQPWHGKRGQHEIFYTDFPHLQAIVQKNWGDFSNIFPARDWVTLKLGELEHPRNVLAHHNPVSENDLKRIELHFNDWIALLRSKRNLIPA